MIDHNPTEVPDDEQVESTDDNETIEFSDDFQMDGEEFIEKLDTLVAAEHRIIDLQKEVEKVNTGLREEDAIRLLYGRSSNWSLSDLRELFGTIDQIEGASSKKLTVRLLADLGNVKLDDAEEFYEEVRRLRQRYGDLATEDDR